MRTIHFTFWRKVFNKWMLLSLIGFSSCDGKFYTVEELTLPQQTNHVKAVKENASEQTYAKGCNPEEMASLDTKNSPGADEKRHSTVRKNTADSSGADLNHCEQ